MWSTCDDACMRGAGAVRAHRRTHLASLNWPCKGRPNSKLLISGLSPNLSWSRAMLASRLAAIFTACGWWSNLNCKWFSAQADKSGSTLPPQPIGSRDPSPDPRDCYDNFRLTFSCSLGAVDVVRSVSQHETLNLKLRKPRVEHQQIQY